jgi:hypothetical protein
MFPCNLPAPVLFTALAGFALPVHAGGAPSGEPADAKISAALGQINVKLITAALDYDSTLSWLFEPGITMSTRACRSFPHRRANLVWPGA